jgi:hypothetical protein
VVRSARAGHVRYSARFTGSKCRSRVWTSLSAKPILASGRKTQKIGRTYERKRSEHAAQANPCKSGAVHI